MQIREALTKLWFYLYVKWNCFILLWGRTLWFVMGVGLIIVIIMLQGCKVRFDWEHEEPETILWSVLTVNDQEYHTFGTSIVLEIDSITNPCAQVVAVNYNFVESLPGIICIED